METFSNDSTNKILNESSTLKTITKSQTYRGNIRNNLTILNNERKIYRKNIFNYKLKLNLFGNLNKKNYNETIESSIMCELKLYNHYEQGYLQITKNTLVVLRNKIETESKNTRNELPTEKIKDLQKYNNNSIETVEWASLSTSINQNKNINNNFLLFLNFNLITCKLVIHKEKQKFRILILGKDNNKTIYQYRTIKFKLTNVNRALFDRVCTNINNSIISSKGYKENIINVSLNKCFCKDYYISCKDFYKLANTGDLVLFKNFSFYSKCQRSITKGEYDHIGLLIKYCNELFLYEITGKDGVILRKWYEFIYYYWFLLCEKMTFRRLNVTQDAMTKFISNNHNEFCHCHSYRESHYVSKFSDSNVNITNKYDLEKEFYYLLSMKIDLFLQKVKGSKYYFSLWKYLCKEKYKNKKTDNFKSKGYFCSELIAAVYNFCEILDDKINITNYLPSSFAQNGDASFNKGFSLGPEYIIIF